MKIRIDQGLLYTKATLIHSNKGIGLNNVVLDTGSAGTVFSIDRLASTGILPGPDDPVCRITGVGGSKLVFTKVVDRLAVGSFGPDGFRIEIGAMDYGFDLDGIIGIGFLLKTKAIVDLDRLELRAKQPL